jgi:hypothetical protein
VGVLAALTRAFSIAVCAGCVTPQAEPVVLVGPDRVAGRASLGSQVVLLTTEPALLHISPDSAQLARHAIAGRDRSKPKLWGLGAIDGTLYSIADFRRLVRFEATDAGFEVRDVAQLDRAVGNMVDTPAGIAVQRAVDAPGEPIAAGLGARGDFNVISAPLRGAMGLARAEEGLMHLLTCSVPPSAICWMPGSNELLAIDDRGIRHLATLHSVPRIAPRLLIARPTARAIQDALWIDEKLFAVLFQDGVSEASVLAEFNPSGAMVRVLAPSQPLRLLVANGSAGLLAVTQAGSLIRVPR